MFCQNRLILIYYLLSYYAKMKKVSAGEQYVCITCGRTDSPEWRKVRPRSETRRSINSCSHRVHSVQKLCAMLAVFAGQSKLGPEKMKILAIVPNMTRKAHKEGDLWRPIKFRSRIISISVDIAKVLHVYLIYQSFLYISSNDCMIATVSI